MRLNLIECGSKLPTDLSSAGHARIVARRLSSVFENDFITTAR
ncbi:MAG: hypothetical protein ACJ8HJ_00275 [Massilia sp.]